MKTQIKSKFGPAHRCLIKGWNEFENAYLTLYYTISMFNDIDKKKKKLLKTLWGKKKMLVTSIFPFPTMFSIHLKNEFLFSSEIYFVVCKCFQFGPV